VISSIGLPTLVVLDDVIRLVGLVLVGRVIRVAQRVLEVAAVALEPAGALAGMNRSITRRPWPRAGGTWK
jgi:hypothetical protein